MAEPRVRPDAIHALVVRGYDKRGDAEARVLSVLQDRQPAVTFATGFPYVEERKRLPFVENYQERFYVVAGFCAGDRAAAVARAVNAEARAVKRGTLACPVILPVAAAGAFERAIESGLWNYAEELADTVLPADARPKAAEIAAENCNTKLAKKLAPEARAPLDGIMTSALRCLRNRYQRPARFDLAAVTDLVELLLQRGADAKKHPEWLTVALADQRLSLAKRLVAAGAEPRLVAPDLLVLGTAGDAETLAWVLSFKPPVDRLNRHVEGVYGTSAASPVLQAAMLGKLDALRLLLLAGAPADGRSEVTGLSALDLLLLFHREAALPLLLFLLDQRPALRAAYDGDVEKLRALPTTALDESWGGWTPLAVATVMGHKEAALFLLGQGASAKVRIGALDDKWTDDLLSLAIKAEAWPLAMQLLSSGAPLDAATAECCSAQPGDEPIAIRTFLTEVLARKDSFDFADKDFGDWFPQLSYPIKKTALMRLRPLHRAALAGQVELVSALLAANVDVDARDGAGLGLTAAMLAASRGHVPVLKALVKAKANLNLADARDFSVLAYAFQAPNPSKVVDAMLTLGGKKLAASSKGTLLAGAATFEAGSEEKQAAIEKLVELGAGKGKEGKRTMRSLCQHGQEQAYRLLERNGLPSVKDENDCGWVSDGD